MDLPFGTANINFDQDPTLGIADAVFSPERIDEVYLDRLLVQYGDHLSILAAPSTLERTFDFGEDAFAELIDVAQRSSPLIVLDVAHGWSGWTRTTLMRADEIVIVATPDLANLRNTKNLLDTLAQLRPNDLKPHLVLNQMGIPKRPEIALADFSEPLGIDPIATIDFDPQLFGNAANNGRMLAETIRKARSPKPSAISRMSSPAGPMCSRARRAAFRALSANLHARPGNGRKSCSAEEATIRETSRKAECGRLR